MPNDTATYYYAMYVIGEVETHWDWTSAHNGALGEGLTIGIMQWYGTRAAGVLYSITSEYPAVAAGFNTTLQNRIATHTATDSYWNGISLGSNELDTISTALATDGGHTVQEDTAIADFARYAETLTGWGASMRSPQAMVFCMAMYHQSPARCRTVMQSGNPQSLQSMYNACMANSVLGQYVTRYTTVYDRLSAWDGESDPPDFGQVGEGGTGGNNGSLDGTTYTEAKAILRWGDQLLLVISSKTSEQINYVSWTVQQLAESTYTVDSLARSGLTVLALGYGQIPDGTTTVTIPAEAYLFCKSGSTYKPVGGQLTNAQSIRMQGDSLILGGVADLEHGAIYYYASDGLWLPHQGISFDDSGDTPEPPFAPEGGGARASTDGTLWWPLTDIRRWTTYPNHGGIDIPAPGGTPIYAAADGVVQWAGPGFHWTYGNYVKIWHPSIGLNTGYAHQSAVACEQGQQVSKGQLIGYVGTTGNSTGNHLHFEIFRPGSESVNNWNRLESPDFYDYFDMS